MDFKLRTNSRIIAMLVLYNYDINSNLDLDNLTEYVKTNNFNIEKEEVGDNVLKYDNEYLKVLVNGVIDNLENIDYLISLATERYSFEFLSYVDRSILRLGTYELVYTDVPKEVVINEMVNIAKTYSETNENNSSKFDNAILDKIAKMKESKN